MKKLILVLLTVLICSPSYADNKWFKQQDTLTPEDKAEETPVEPKPNFQVPKTVPPGTTQSLGVFLRAPCGKWKEMQASIMKYSEHLLFTGSGLTFSPQGQVYNGAMMFFVNQETGTWTVLQAYGDGMACMIFNGKQFTPYSGDQPYGDR